MLCYIIEQSYGFGVRKKSNIAHQKNVLSFTQLLEIQCKRSAWFFEALFLRFVKAEKIIEPIGTLT